MMKRPVLRAGGDEDELLAMQVRPAARWLCFAARLGFPESLNVQRCPKPIGSTGLGRAQMRAKRWHGGA